MITAGYFPALALLHGGSLESGMQDLRQKFWVLMAANWKIWIPANFLNFYLVPIPYQVLCSNVTGLFYNVVLSFIAHSHPK